MLFLNFFVSLILDCVCSFFRMEQIVERYQKAKGTFKNDSKVEVGTYTTIFAICMDETDCLIFGKIT